MFENTWYRKLRDELRRLDHEKNELRGQYVRLLQIELGLRALELLRITDEPATVLWIILSGLSLRDHHLSNLDQVQKRVLANARVLLPFNGRTSWESALKDYADAPLKWRCYDIKVDDIHQPAARTGNFSKRLTEYDKHLNGVLSHKEKRLKRAHAGEATFLIKTRMREKEITIDIPQALITSAEVPLPWFGSARERKPLQVTHAELCKAAGEMDKREKEHDIPCHRWQHLINEVVRYRTVHSNENLGKANTETFMFDGMNHIAGMVGSGKSTLMQILAAHAILHTDWRITLVVGDVMTALNMADYFNRLLCDSDHPVAVALMGRSNRDYQLSRLYKSVSIHPRRQHWGLRWLNTTCLVQGLSKLNDLPEPLAPGDEPCENLFQANIDSRRSNNMDEDDAEDEVIEKQGRVSCPLFAICPVHQLYRDMPLARIWITTPGALGSAELPAQVERRTLKLGELVYEQSDIVVFDEVDTIQEWFDNLYAPELPMLDSRSGLLDQLDVHTAQGWVRDRAQPTHSRRWLLAERNTTAMGSHILSQLDQIGTLASWVGNNSFSSLKLFFDLAKRLCGILEKEDINASGTLSKERLINLKTVWNCFEELLQTNPLIAAPPKDGYSDPVYRLQLIVNMIIARGDSNMSRTTEVECRNWIRDFVPDITNTLKELERHAKRWQADYDNRKRRKLIHPEPNWPTPDDLDSLTKRLQFALSVAALDQNMRVVFDEWYNRPAAITGDFNDQGFQRAPRDLVSVLPVPPTGRIFGYYYRKDESRAGDVPLGEPAPSTARRLSVFEYSNIGRWYVSQFHHLLTNLDGKAGPHVIALSGTSWLPDSSRWHFDAAPKAVLDPSDMSKQAIAKSTFTFLPQFTEENGQLQPIEVSGHPRMIEQLTKVAANLAGGRDSVNAPLSNELDELTRLAEKDPQHWANRQRILLLVNSYDQVKAVAHEIAIRMFELPDRDQVVALVRAADGSEEWLPYGTIGRGAIEGFAQTRGKILIAPLQAIGRGYNILNQDRSNEDPNRELVAALGSIYFLMRPMPQPYDSHDIARKLNRQTLDWCNDPTFKVWKVNGLYQKGTALRNYATRQRRILETRNTYSSLSVSMRNDLAATTAGLVIQACGRLVRGGVPFRACFVDAKWAPRTARGDGPDTPEHSLLAAMIQVMQRYTNSAIGNALYAPLVAALSNTQNFEYELGNRESVVTEEVEAV